MRIGHGLEKVKQQRLKEKGAKTTQELDQDWLQETMAKATYRIEDRILYGLLWSLRNIRNYYEEELPEKDAMPSHMTSIEADFGELIETDEYDFNDVLLLARQAKPENLHRYHLVATVMHLRELDPDYFDYLCWVNNQKYLGNAHRIAKADAEGQNYKQRMKDERKAHNKRQANREKEAARRTLA